MLAEVNLKERAASNQDKYDATEPVAVSREQPLRQSVGTEGE